MTLFPLQSPVRVTHACDVLPPEGTYGKGSVLSFPFGEPAFSLKQVVWSTRLPALSLTGPCARVYESKINAVSENWILCIIILEIEFNFTTRHQPELSDTAWTEAHLQGS